MNPQLNITLAKKIDLDNPIILGAGWDKTGRVVKSMWRAGFGAIEVGSITLNSQAGNAKPRQFSPKSGVLINSMGANSPGAAKVAKNLSKYKNIPTGINIAVNRGISEAKTPLYYSGVIKILYPYATYFTLNVSSPNTPGLRKLQNKRPLNRIINSCLEIMDQLGGKKPLFIKIDPDLPLRQLDKILEVAIDNKIAGIVATNTTTNPQIKAKYGFLENGGLSGDDPDFRKLSNEKIKFVYKHAGKNLDIIGVGGVKDLYTALEKIMLGAKAIQIVSVLYTQGPYVANKINRQLVEWMDREGVKNIQEIVGQEALKY